MKKNKRYVLIFFLLFISKYSFAQIDTLTLSEIYRGVFKYHPVAKQAALQIRQSQGELTESRGVFDPKLFYERDHKYYEGKNYFDIHHTALKIPTWYGIDIEGGYEYSTGQFTNPESEIPSAGLSYAGLSINVLKGLIIDQRRATLRQASAGFIKSRADAEQRLNELTYEIGQSYIEWLVSHQLVNLLENTVNLNEIRLTQLRQTVKSGERASIDTLEGFLLTEGFKIQLIEAKARLIKARYLLSVHIWGPENRWYEITESAVPSEIGLEWLDSFIASIPPSVMLPSIVQTHPLLVSSNLEVRIAAIQRDLAQYNMLPQLALKYNVLSTGWNEWSRMNGPFYSNYKFGVDASIPLLFRAERGKFVGADAKFRVSENKFDFKNREVQNKMLGQWQALENYRQVYERFDGVVKGYYQLLQAEETRFMAGESTLFQLYTRELRYVENRIKQTQNFQKLLETLLEYGVASGQLHKLLPKD